jgi:hypothetical protein
VERRRRERRGNVELRIKERDREREKDTKISFHSQFKNFSEKEILSTIREFSKLFPLSCMRYTLPFGEHK